jgi:cag pathogenicity island protein 24
MKYRLLSLAELSVLEEPFVIFLSANGIDAQDWEKIKQNDHSRRDEILEQFSDMVFDQTLDRAEYLVFRMEKTWLTYFCGPAGISMKGLKLSDGCSQNFINITDNDSLNLFLEMNQEFIGVVSDFRPYIIDRKSDVFALTESGAQISSGSLYEFFEKLNEMNS